MYKDKLAIYYDAEFTGLHKETTLISIGLVAEGGHYFYGEFTDYDKNQVDDWVREHVINNLILEDKIAPYVNHIKPKFVYPGEHYSIEIKGDRNTIRDELLNWLSNESVQEKKQLQFFTDCYAYDWVLLMDLVNQYNRIPEYINYIPIDLCSFMYMKGIDPDIGREFFATSFVVNILRESLPFSEWSKVNDDSKHYKNIKHNSLWDAYISRFCFSQFNPTPQLRD